MNDARQPIPSFTGKGVVNDVVFKSQATSVFTLPVTVQYEATSPVDINNDAALLALTNSCLNSNPTPLYFKYTVNVIIPLISWTGFQPTISSVITISCPDNVIDLLGNMISGRG